MKKLIIILILSKVLFANEIYINGRVTAFSSNGEEYPKDAITINILNTSIETKSNQKGFFHLILDGNKYTSGTKIRLQVENVGWYIYAPYDGVFFLPKNLEDFDLKIKIVMNSSVIKNSYFNVNVNSNQSKNKKPQPVIQIASFHNKSSAEKELQNIIKKRYHKAFIKKIDSQYKVFISIFKTKKEANKFLKFFTKKYSKEYSDAFVSLIAI